MADAEMNNENLIRLMKRETARSVPWGVMLLVVVLISTAWIKQDVREGVEFTTQTIFRDAKAAVLDPHVFVPLKQSVKRTIRYTAYTAINEAKDAVLTADTFVPMKRKVKEAIEYTARTGADQYKRVQTELNNRK